MRYLLFTFSFVVAAAGAFAQTPKVFTRADTLRGSNGEFRQKWDVLHYDITVEPDIAAKTIQGKNVMRFYDAGAKLMQIDLQEPMVLDSAVSEGSRLTFTREKNVYWLMFRDSTRMYKIKPGIRTIALYFHGKPKEAKRAPWDGGWIWKKDANGKPWVTVACQGLGASVWYPCKDIQSDKPDSGAVLRIIAPDSLMAVGNGQRTDMIRIGNGKRMTVWTTKNPINNYCIVPYIGDYVEMPGSYPSIIGNLDVDYWVLKDNVAKAETHFTDVPKMLKAFEYWFGRYPFYEDGFKLVESPYLGMEHQSAIAYGNNYKKGYLGTDLSLTGIGLLWDFIIVHESGHEWFANSICAKDIADMWVHEGFTNYSETLFIEYHWGKDSANRYLQGIRVNIENDIPIIGKYGVNKQGSGDMYYKAANMIHLVRQLTTDKKFRNMLLEMNRVFYHKTVTTQEVESFMSKRLGLRLQPVFDQYLRTIKVPELEYKTVGKTVSCRFTNVVDGFSLLLPVSFGSAGIKRVKVGTRWTDVKAVKNWDGTTFVPDANFYITIKKQD